ncbi:hypothetical protein CPJCM30710_33570 [Clostridium polyendosporum]|uniref:Uncharacterized protein n=1 Tax=Clostridium polyendosporum TaxID=69208 RepID=A0A919VIF6_9CLOT|nr:hypothetical protein [Clostridium polyendosporum]GIM30691.1 hypothetical protein CPJCM30710_33570 [Clostridium polyendosporum]
MKVGNITKGGLFVAITVVFLYIASVIPTNKLSLLTLASVIIPISVITTSISNSFIVYLAASITSLMVINKTIALSYVIFFGLYGFIKHYTEKINNLFLEITLKFIFFNLCFFILYTFYKTFFIKQIPLKIPFIFVTLAVQAIFLIFDYVLTLIISYFYNRLKNKGLF